MFLLLFKIAIFFFNFKIVKNMIKLKKYKKFLIIMKFFLVNDMIKYLLHNI
jgi:hypothetical protein